MEREQEPVARQVDLPVAGDQLNARPSLAGAPVEVEDVLNSHPKVKAAGVAGIPDPDHGQMVVGLIIPASQGDMPSGEELAAYTSERLADRKVPGKWIFVDRLPLTPMAKIDRKALAEMALGEK